MTFIKKFIIEFKLRRARRDLDKSGKIAADARSKLEALQIRRQEAIDRGQDPKSMFIDYLDAGINDAKNEAIALKTEYNQLSDLISGHINELEAELKKL